MRTLWTAGLSGWASAPAAPLERQEGDPDTRVLSCSSGSRAQLVGLLRKYIASGVLTNRYLLALCRDSERASGGRDR
jgi:hypothetical protein